MYSINRMGGVGPQQTRHFSTDKKPYFNNMPPSTTDFLSKINFDMQNISSQKKFVNPNFVSKINPNMQSCPRNLKLNPCREVRDVCPDMRIKTGSLNVPPFLYSRIPFNTDTEKKEDTQKKKDCRKLLHGRKSRDHSHSPRKAHKNKMNIDLKYEIDEVGIDVLSDAFESDSNDNTPLVDLTVPPVFIHEALPRDDVDREMFPMPSSPICIAFGTPEKIPKVVFSINAETRRRLPSDCGSEDSFIVFQCSTEDADDDDDDISDFGTDTESEDESDTDSTDSDYKDLYAKTDAENSKDLSKDSKKVTFANNLCEVHPMVQWSFAYQAARKGPWEEYARDRSRFKDRIAKMEATIGPILQKEHRQQVYKERYL